MTFALFLVCLCQFQIDVAGKSADTLADTLKHNIKWQPRDVL